MPQSPKPDFVSALRFGFLTRHYDAVIGISTRERTFKSALIRQAGIEAGQLVLDLASGTGTMAIWLKQAYPTAMVTGVDGDPVIVAIANAKARKAGASVQFDEALSYSLPYEAARFHRVLSSLFFHHLNWENKQRTARELFRVLKPGGELHVADWGRPANLLMRALFVPVQLLDGMGNTQENAAGKLVGLFEQAGFSEVSERQAFNTVFGTLALISAVKRA